METTAVVTDPTAPDERSRKLGQTYSYYFAFIAIGLTTASLGPTLPGLSDQTRSQLRDISFLFTARALGYMIGSFVGGRLYDRLPGHRTMAAAILLTSGLLALVPNVPMLLVLTAVLLGIGLMEGVIDVGGNTLIVWVHREKVGPYMNGLHFFYGVGAFLSPIIIAQALVFTGKFAWGYWMLALLLIPVMLRLLTQPSPAPIITRENIASARTNPTVLGLVILFFLLFAGAEQSFGGWIYTYSLSTNLTDITTAAYLNAAFWGALTVGRLISIPLAARVRPRVVLLADLSGALVGLIIILAGSNSLTLLWVGTLVFGFSMASAFPTMLTFAGRHMTITGRITGWFFVGASIGGMLVPWLIGQLFESAGPQSAIVTIFISLALALSVFVTVLLYLARREKGKPPAPLGLT